MSSKPATPSPGYGATRHPSPTQPSHGGPGFTHLPLRQPGRLRADGGRRHRAYRLRQRDQAEQDSRAETSWRERALNAENALKTAHAEIRAQRTRIGQLLGQLRDAERELTGEAVQRTATENTTLKQRVRQLTADNRTPGLAAPTPGQRQG